jgi:hypothetical protein
MRARHGLVALAPLLALGLTGCLDIRTVSSTATEPGISASPSADAPTDGTTPGTAPTAPAGPPTDITPPGTELAVGESALIPIAGENGETVTGLLSVTSVVQGSGAELVDWPDEVADPSAVTPYYVTVRFEALSGSISDHYIDIPFNVMSQSGERSDALITDDHPRCPVNYQSTFAPGDVIETCTIEMLPVSDPMSHVSYNDFEAYSRSDGLDVRWFVR